MRVASVVLALIAAGAAYADDADVTARLFGTAPLGPAARACFTRHYGAAHLAAHPKQNVADMTLLVGTERIEGEVERRLAFQLSTHLRNKTGRLESGGSCGPKGATADCAVDCDGGGLSLVPTPDGKSITARAARLRVWRAGSSPEETAQDLDVGGDDHLFRLERASLDQCTPLLPKAERLKRLRRK